MLRKTTICIMTRVSEATMPNIVRGGGCGESTGRRVLERIKLPPYYCIEEVHAEKKRSLTEKPKGSKLMEQLLSVVK
jgi:hypothetical protein